MLFEYRWHSSDETAERFHTIDPFIFKWLWSLSDQNLQKGKCLTNDIFRFERMNMCRSFVALTRRAFVQTFIFPSSNAKKQHNTQRSEGPFVFCLTRHELTYSPNIFFSFQSEIQYFVLYPF